MEFLPQPHNVDVHLSSQQHACNDVTLISMLISVVIQFFDTYTKSMGLGSSLIVFTHCIGFDSLPLDISLKKLLR